VQGAGFSALQRAENSSTCGSGGSLEIVVRFSALQRAENSSIGRRAARADATRAFQCSSASRKFLKLRRRVGIVESCAVSVLFSEPKIPQCCGQCAVCQDTRLFQCSSASRKFLNRLPACRRCGVARFQCSSASRKFLNEHARAEGHANGQFQCSSASRKFLNSAGGITHRLTSTSFSALQRAENSSMTMQYVIATLYVCFSALQRAENSSTLLLPPVAMMCPVSVLFSEPKIPQTATPRIRRRAARFQCSSASRKFLNLQTCSPRDNESNVLVLFSEPKIPQYGVHTTFYRTHDVSVLFSEPKIPQSRAVRSRRRGGSRFQCSSASRKFLNCHCRSMAAPNRQFQCSSASRKFLNRILGVCERRLADVSVLFSEPKIPQKPTERAWTNRSSVSVLFSEPKIPQF